MKTNLKRINRKPSIWENQRIQWRNDNGQKDKQRSTKRYWATRAQLNTGSELGCSSETGSSCATCALNYIFIYFSLFTFTYAIHVYRQECLESLWSWSYSEWVSNHCLTQSDNLFCYIIVRASYILMRWCSVCTKLPCLIWHLSTKYTEQCADKHITMISSCHILYSYTFIEHA